MGTTTGYVLVVLLASICYVSTSAVPTVASDVTVNSDPPVVTPNGKVYVYKYSASIAAGQNEPAPFASKLQIDSKLIYKSQSNAFYLKFHDLQYKIYNGRDDGTYQGKFYPIEEAVDSIHQPFLAVYNDDHKIKGIKFEKENEATWSKNIKRGLVSLFHLDRKDNATASTYPRTEDTVYGTCNVNYSISNVLKAGEKLKIVEQSYQPRSCSKFVLFDVTDSKDEDCSVPAEEDLVTEAKKVHTYGSIKNVSDYILKQIISHEKFSYLPWSHRNYGVQFIETNQTVEFEKVADESEFKLPSGKFDDVKMSNVTFDTREYIPNISSAEEVQLGRNQADAKETLVPIVKKLLVDMIDLLKDNQLEIELKNPEQKYLLEDLYRYLGYMDAQALRYLLNHFNVRSEKGQMTRKIFLLMLPHVGTEAVWEVVKDMLKKSSTWDIDEEMILNIIENLPLYVLNPTKKLANKMSDMKEIGDHLSYQIKRAGILSYSILLNKIYKSVDNDNVPMELDIHLKAYYDRIIYENTYNSKIVNMMALRNVGVGIYKYLAPFVKGEGTFYVDVMIEKREKYQIAAAWAVAKSISHDYNKTYDLFWPILANTSNSLALRITAYELLVPRNPLLDMKILTRLHSLMENEKDEHMFNYHYTTLKSNAESTSPCAQLQAENMRKILQLTKPRKVLSAALSTANVQDYYDTKYGQGKTFKMAAEMNEATGLPQTGYYEVITTYARKPKLTTGYYWNIDGLNLKSIIELTKNQITPPSLDILTERTDDKIQKILRQTEGYKRFDRHIHVELWTISKGYVTSVQVYFENGLSDLLRRLVNTYKLDFDQLMNINSQWTVNAVDIAFDNHYKMVVPTGLGLPAMFYNDAPYLSYVKIKPNISLQKNTVAVKVEFDARYQRNHVYQMKFYNPFADITHSVQRHTIAAAALPIDVTFSLQMPAQSLKLELSRLPKQSAAAGIKIETVDQVVIHKDVFKNYLQTHCPTCNNHTVITNGPNHRNTHLQVQHNLDSGLEMTYGTYNCETDFEPNAYLKELYRTFYSPTNNRKDDIFSKLWMVVDQGAFNYVNNPYTSTCGMIVKVAPCTKHPVSRVEMNWRASVGKVGQQAALTLRGNVDVKSAKTNETMRNWDIDLSTELFDYMNVVRAKLTRKVPDEKNLKICFEAVKSYPKLEADASKIEYKTHGKVSLSIGRSNADECATHEVDIKAEIIGERLEEQIEDMRRYVQKPGSCFKNASNPLDMDVNKPIDWNCLYEVVKGTTMRSYTADVSYKKLPNEYSVKLQLIRDWLFSFWGSDISYRPEHTEEGHAKIYISYPASKSYGNITFVNPSDTLEITDVIYEQDDVENRQNDLILDNTVFTTAFLVDFYKNDIRPCIAHAHELINDMNQTIPMEFKDWTLMSGDHGLMSYAVFVKTIANDKVAVRIHVADNVLEITPGESKPSVTLNGNAIIYDNEQINTDSNLNINLVNKLLVVETKKLSKVKVYYSPYNVIVMPHMMLDRNVDGICGHMGTTTYTQQVPLVYSSA